MLYSDFFKLAAISRTENPMPFTILIVKETRANEQRVSLIPSDVQALVERGHCVFVEHQAGQAAGFSDDDYRQAGASIRHLAGNRLADYQQLFANIQVIVRVKRAQREREIFENQAIAAKTVMIGALDPLEKASTHQQEYQQAGITAYSLDQFSLAPNDPMNVLAAMSQLAGRLGLNDAISKHPSPIDKVLIIGFGTVGQAAATEARQRHLPFTVMAGPEKTRAIEAMGGQIIILDKTLSLAQQQQVYQAVQQADLVISSARQANQPAPILIPLATLQAMKKGAVVVDMALSEGGNVEGSEHDATHILGNGVLVTNVSGYPKALPREASVAWSTASLQALLKLAQGLDADWPRVSGDSH